MVINNADSNGTACNFQPYGYYLGDSARTYWGLPNMPNYNLGPLNSIWQSTLSQDKTFICKGDSTTKGVTLKVDTVPGVTYAWQPAPGIDSLATTQIVYPPQSTWYYVTFTDTTLQGTCNSRTDSVYVEIRDCDTMGIQQIARGSIQRLTIYPNPAQNIATVEWQPIGELLQLSVSDLLGREIKTMQVNGITGTAQLDISSFPNGIYIVKLLAGNGPSLNGKLSILK